MKTTLLRAARVLLALAPGGLISLPASAGTLEATVTGRSGKPKQYVRVELIGPQSRTLFTNQHGQLAVEVPGGSYVVRITERNRQMEFEVEVPEEGEAAETLELEW